MCLQTAPNLIKEKQSPHLQRWQWDNPGVFTCRTIEV